MTLLICVLSLLGGLLQPAQAPAAPTFDPSSAAAVPEETAWPLRPRPAVLHRFDPPRERWGSGHRGVDLAGRAGEPVLAAADGEVTFAGMLAGVGVVVVDHGDTRTTYQPVVAVVEVGDAVHAGQTVGRLEVAGSHCLPVTCLHWGWIRGEAYLDPLRLVGAAPVRLLPLNGGARSTRRWRLPGAAGPRLSPTADGAHLGPRGGSHPVDDADTGTGAGGGAGQVPLRFVRPVGVPGDRPGGGDRR
jgi:hypothetical protein